MSAQQYTSAKSGKSDSEQNSEKEQFRRKRQLFNGRTKGTLHKEVKRKVRAIIKNLRDNYKKIGIDVIDGFIILEGSFESNLQKISDLVRCKRLHSGKDRFIFRIAEDPSELSKDEKDSYRSLENQSHVK